MKHIPNTWSINQTKLKTLLSKEADFDEGISLLLDMHSLLHEGKVSGISETFYDNLWEGLKAETCKVISNKETSIIWDIWHITRIEDIVTNTLIGNTPEILSDALLKKMHIPIRDTGNAMNYDEIAQLNNSINISALNEYRLKTGIQTQKIIRKLTFADMKRKVTSAQLAQIKESGGVLENEKSAWLLDFWGKKNVLGLIMMPITRHQTVHLNDCFSIKEKYNK
ncbi:MAG: DinB family protein [Spirochaetaceae bacterium]|jgi:hypothetical protein|nr:DinB family protein [Spirochaetaceae bacterium]